MNNSDFSPTRGLALADPLVMEPVRRTDRLLARACGASLDQQLAAGCLPESTRLLAARAQHIVSLPRRTSLAASWGHLLSAARRAPSPRVHAVPLRSATILAAEPEIRELMQSLTTALPVAARGVAMASVLLTEPTSPVYSRRGPRSLADRLQDAIIALDPAQPLMHTA
jgi:hypothetical protein